MKILQITGHEKWTNEIGYEVNFTYGEEKGRYEGYIGDKCSEAEMLGITDVEDADEHTELENALSDFIYKQPLNIVADRVEQLEKAEKTIVGLKRNLKDMEALCSSRGSIIDEVDTFTDKLANHYELSIDKSVPDLREKILYEVKDVEHYSVIRADIIDALMKLIRNNTTLEHEDIKEFIYEEVGGGCDDGTHYDWVKSKIVGML